ncbi:MAG: hypothetical protein KGS48_11585 [Bacteroidetes bacterium]|nr:hypothetical protein [Bacteroidota bacterium]
MFRYLPCFFLALLFLGEACKKEQSQEVPVSPTDTIKDVIELGKCTCTSNSEHWPLTTNQFYYPKRKDVFKLYMNYTTYYARSFTAFVKDIPTKPGKYILEKYIGLDTTNNLIPQMVLLVAQDQDQLIGRYYADSTRTDHFIEVVSYDSIKGIVQGRFQFFTIGNNISAPNSWGLDPAINLTEGKFHLKLQ